MRFEIFSKILSQTTIKTSLDEYGTEDLEEMQQNCQETMHELF